jgi:hypothetical protein
VGADATPLAAAEAAAAAAVSAAAASASGYFLPERDSDGLFLPSHHRPREVPVRSALKSAPSPSDGEQDGGEAAASARRKLQLGGVASPSGAADGGPPRRISFADQHGGSITNVHYSATLHYGENSLHEDDVDDDPRGGGGESSCTIV